MGPALGERVHVVERGARVVEGGRAVHAASAAVSEGRHLDRPLLFRGDEAAHSAEQSTPGAGEADAMTVSSGQSHLAGKDDTPRREKLPVAGCRTPLSWSGC